MVAHRRLFPGDSLRYFIGLVDGRDGGVIKVCGKTWTRDSITGKYLCKKELRTKILSLTSGSLIIYQLSQNFKVDKAEIRIQKDGATVLTDGSRVEMDLSENFTD